MPSHRVVIRDALIALFASESAVHDDDAVGRTIPTPVLGPSPIDFGKPVFNFRDNEHLSIPVKPGATSVVWKF
jgi:hypothetical protein